MNILKSLLNVSCPVIVIITLSVFGTPAEEAPTDADGNVYSTVTIGKQVWVVENLKTTKYNDGTRIPFVTGQSEWSTGDDNAKPAYCWYGNDTLNKAKYGALYNWYAVNTGKLAPKGWHVATDADWMELENYLIQNGYNWDETAEENRIAKSIAAQTDWAWAKKNTSGTVGNDSAGNNRSGFSALPGGFRLISGNYRNIGTTGRWWTATEYDSSRAWRRNLRYDSDNLNREYYFKGCGFSVRWLKD